ncbi:MAG: hypothetical protein ACPGUE_09790 [Marinomonas sp.]
MNNFFKSNREVINGLAAIATSLGVLTALFFSVKDAYFNEKKSTIILSQYKSFSNPATNELIIYNSGDAPCVNLVITYSNDFKSVSRIHNYPNASLSAVEFDQKTNRLTVPARVTEPLKDCKKDSCLYYPGYLAPQELLAMSFTGKFDDNKVIASCSDATESIQLVRN